MLSDLFSSFFVHADAKPEESEDEKVKNNNNSDDGDKAEETPEGEGEGEGETSSEETPEEEEEEEPEDAQPAIREECANSAKCAPLKKHFDHCQEKVQEGHGFKGEDCVEEILMHCADTCAAPKVFAKLR